jgi:hypothetical protein
MKEKSDEVMDKNTKIKILLKLDNHRYSPSEEVEGLLMIKKSKNMKLNDFLKHSDCFISLQQKIAYKYSANDNEISIIDKKIIKFGKIDECEDKKIVKIPIKYKIPNQFTNNFYPSFRYFSKNMKCIINHSICVEFPFISNQTSVNIFIRKMPLEKISEELNKSVFGDEHIKKFFILNKGRLTYYIRTKKTIAYKEKLPVEIHLNEREVGDNTIESVDMKIIKHIYLYNELNIYSDYLEESFDEKKIILKNKDIKNNTIFENFELPAKEFIPIPINDIHKIDYKKDTFNFTPPIKNCLFKCEYFLQIVFNFNKKFVKDKIINIPIDYYDPEFDKKKIDDKKDNNDNYLLNSLNSINDSEDNEKEFNEVFRKTINIKTNNINNTQQNDTIDKLNSINNGIFSGFVDITNEDLIKMVDGK